MRQFLRNPIVTRVLGAVAAGAVTYFTTGDLKGAMATAATFAIYGSMHKGTEQAASK
jgi:hypothetical protein